MPQQLTPELHRQLEEKGGRYLELADPELAIASSRSSSSSRRRPPGGTMRRPANKRQANRKFKNRNRQTAALNISQPRRGGIRL